jgi:membrane protein
MKQFGADHCGVYAAGISYFALLSLFPLALFAVSVAGFIFTDPEDQEAVVDALLDLLPFEEEGQARDEVEKIIDTIVQDRGALGIIGLVGVAWSASAMFGAMRAGLNRVFHAQKNRPYVIGKAFDLLLVLGFAVLLLLSVAATFAVTFAENVVSEYVTLAPLLAWIEWTVYRLAPALVSFLIFTLLFKYIPARKVEMSYIVAGAFISAFLFEILKIGFALYVQYFSNYTTAYGAIGFVIILLIFFYFSAQIVLVGAEFARSLEDMRQAGPDRYVEIPWVKGLVVSWGRKVPVMGKRLFPEGAPQAPPSPQPTAPVEAIVVTEGAAAANGALHGATSGVTDPSAAGGVPAPANSANGDEPRRRPGAFAGVALAAGAVAALVSGIRRR